MFKNSTLFGTRSLTAFFAPNIRASKEVYLNEYKNIQGLNRAIEKYMNTYNSKRLHSTIGYKTPNEIYYQASNNLDSRR